MKYKFPFCYSIYSVIQNYSYFREMKIFNWCFLVGLIMLCTCTVPKEHFPETPALTFASFSRQTVERLDTFTITMDFTDGDGDIGVSSGSVPRNDTICVTPDSVIITNPGFNLFYRDLRDSCIQFTQTAYYAPAKGKEAIRGQIVVTITAACKKVCSSQPCTDTAYYEFLLRDRAWHYSNWVKTPGIAVTGCQ